MKKGEVRIFSKMRRVKCVSKDLKIDSLFDTSSGNLCAKIVFIALNVIFTAILQLLIVLFVMVSTGLPNNKMICGQKQNIKRLYIQNAQVYVDIRHIFETYNMVQKWQSKWKVELSSTTTGIQSATLSENGTLQIEIIMISTQNNVWYDLRTLLIYFQINRRYLSRCLRAKNVNYFDLIL